MTIAPPLPAVAPPGPGDMFRRAADKLRPQPVPPKRRKWLETARENQLPPPGDWWFVWFILAGRGFGKTRSGAEHVAQFMRDHPGCEVGVIGRTDAEARRLLLNGPSGLLSVLETWEVKRVVQAPGDTILEHVNGAKCYIAGANSPDALRGLNLWAAWADELAAWRYQQVIWDEVLEPAVRIGPHPHILVTTTPKPTKLVRTLLKDAMAHIVRGSTFENAANLSSAFIRRMKAKYDGTRSGRQELYAEVLDDVPGALVTSDVLEASRVTPTLDDDGRPTLDVVAPSAKLNGLYREAVVALDPADGTDEGDEQALALVGLGYDHELYIEHVEGMKESVTEYLGRAVDMAEANQATIVVEKNHGGKYLIATLEQVMKEKGIVVPVRVVTASEGKRVRAEPIVPLFTRNKAHFVGQHPAVEDQLTSWVGAAGEKSPDQMDAVVWGITHFLRHRLEAPTLDDGGAYDYAQQAGATDWTADYDDDGTYDYA